MPEVQPSDEQIQRHKMEKLKDTLEIAVQLIRDVTSFLSFTQKRKRYVNMIAWKE